MDKEIVGVLIAAASGVTGAIIGFLTTYFTKVRELKMIAQQKDDETHYEELRHRIETVYIPLNAAINKLTGQYDEFIELKFSVSQNAPDEGAVEQLEAGAYKFKDACRECVTRITDVWDQGMNIFLTGELEWILKEFKDFLRHAEVRHPSFSRSEDFSIFVKEGYTFAGDRMPIISPVFDKSFNNYRILIRSQFHGIVFGNSLRYYQNSVKKQIEDITKKQTKQPYFWYDKH